MPVSVLIASASPAYAHGLAGFIARPEVATAVVHSAGAALGHIATQPVQVAIVDVQLVDGPGFDLVSELARRHPALPVVCAVPDGAPKLQDRALKAGACGVMLAGWARDLVVDAVEEALRSGGRSTAVRRLPSASSDGAAPALTEQERIVLRLMRQHLTYKEIAQHLGVSWHTVRTHAQSVLRKSGVHSRRELLVWADEVVRDRAA